jgi:hypothetical protein
MVEIGAIDSAHGERDPGLNIDIDLVPRMDRGRVGLVQPDSFAALSK